MIYEGSDVWWQKMLTSPHRGPANTPVNVYMKRDSCNHWKLDLLCEGYRNAHTQPARSQVKVTHVWRSFTLKPLSTIFPVRTLAFLPHQNWIYSLWANFLKSKPHKVAQGAPHDASSHAPKNVTKLHEILLSSASHSLSEDVSTGRESGHLRAADQGREHFPSTGGT